jgi:hypothetical protein
MSNERHRETAEGPILEIHMQSHDYECGLCGVHVGGPGGWCLMVVGSGGGILVCEDCSRKHPDGEVEP